LAEASRTGAVDILTGSPNNVQITVFSLPSPKIRSPKRPTVVPLSMASFTFNSPLGEPSKEISVSATSGFNALRNRKTRQQDIQAYTQQYVDILEKQILETPYNWFNFYDYWQNDEQ
jgi:hypothetical protein